MLGKLPEQELIIIKINLISYTILSYLKIPKLLGTNNSNRINMSQRIANEGKEATQPVL